MSINSIRHILKSSDFGDLSILLKEAFEDYLVAILNFAESITDKFSYIYNFNSESRIILSNIRKQGDLLSWIQDLRKDIKKIEDMCFERVKDIDSLLSKNNKLSKLITKKNESASDGYSEENIESRFSSLINSIWGEDLLMSSSSIIEPAISKLIKLDSQSKFSPSKNHKKKSRSKYFLQDFQIKQFLEGTEDYKGNFTMINGKKLFISDEILKIDSLTAKINDENQNLECMMQEPITLSFHDENFKWKIVGGDLNHHKIWIYSLKKHILA